MVEHGMISPVCGSASGLFAANNHTAKTVAKTHPRKKKKSFKGKPI